MKQGIRERAREIMEESVGDFVDESTGEVSATDLAEFAAEHLWLWDNEELPDWLMDAAVDVAVTFEDAKEGARTCG